ncbi:MAG: phosphatase PAP2 family protein [Chitinophagaceae bacterium]
MMKESPAQKRRRLWLSPDRTITKILLVASLLLLLFLVWVVFFYGKNTFDQEVFDWIAPYTTAGRTRFMLFITFLGNPAFLIPANLVLLIYFIIRKNKWPALSLLLISLGGLAIKLLLKQVFHRLRPDNSLIEGGVGGFSFPSGHALLGLAFYGFLVWLTAHHIRKGWLQYGIILLLILLILAISFSRVYLRVHYATDITAGLCIGFIWLSFSFWFINKKEKTALQRGNQQSSGL